MQLTATTVQVTSGGSSRDTVQCGFDPEGTAHLMRLLSNLYRNAAAAVLREYSANAYDSHVQAGNPGPVEVTLPSDLNPTLVITDHGTGLSSDEMIGVYSRYGASTKRGTNDQVGAFGLGTKSAFTLGQQFIVNAVKDGWRTIAAFGLDTSGTGTVTILDHEPPASATASPYPSPWTTPLRCSGQQGRSSSPGGQAPYWSTASVPGRSSMTRSRSPRTFTWPARPNRTPPPGATRA